MIPWHEPAPLATPSRSIPAASRTSREWDLGGSISQYRRRAGSSERRTVCRAGDETGGRLQPIPKAGWRGVQFEPTYADITLPPYRAMLERSGDRCGTIRLAGRSIGAPFVGSAAAALAVGELMRLCTGGKSYELVSCHLRDLRDLTAVLGSALPAFNPGSVAAAA